MLSFLMLIFFVEKIASAIPAQISTASPPSVRRTADIPYTVCNLIANMETEMIICPADDESTRHTVATADVSSMSIKREESGDASSSEKPPVAKQARVGEAATNVSILSLLARLLQMEGLRDRHAVILSIVQVCNFNMDFTHLHLCKTILMHMCMHMNAHTLTRTFTRTLTRTCTRTCTSSLTSCTC